ncbi:signal peptidase II [Serpentinicella sp. ANB-PHB4]|uniref:signal peptidase II n=1 Tax=Serpentinicella sp. ANB-PHB4 TaxID=3074076 RepID=UPI002858D697|nr:signal peptidase II [Serpentinicella sp. ANB-PHB4]MDR5657929.1 signal peptidase II [Serpentinicella sp. ANB-PHB4]
MWILIALFIIIFDQITKTWVVSSLKEIRQMYIVENILHFTYVENRGAAFGIMQDQKLFFIIVTFIILAVMIYYLLTIDNLKKSVIVSLSLIIGGAIGNLIDRIRFGYVIDFIDFRVWPVFNIADIAIVIGQIILIYVVLKYDNLKQKEL